MKFLFSFLLLLNFLCFQAQEKDSVNNEKIEDVVILGRPKINCQKIYDNEKALYEKQSEELKKLNFERLFDELLKLKEFRKIKSDERKIVILKNEGQEMSRTDNQYQFKDGKWKLLKNK